MARPSRRTFNNILIIGILGFIALMNLPPILQKHFAEQQTPVLEETPSRDGIIELISPDLAVKALQFPTFTLTKASPWLTDADLTVSATELANRWMHLSGTEIDADTFAQLKPSLAKPATLVVDLGETVEPLRLTYYQLPQFWLFKNWQNRWLAVSVDPNYLFPLTTQK